MKIRTTIVAEQTSNEVVQKVGLAWGFPPEILAMAHHYIWIILYDEKDAIGLVAAFPQHPAKVKAGLVIEYMFWNPRESARRKLEAAVTFMRAIPASHNIGMIGYSDEKDFKFFKALQKQGCIRKIGMQRTGFAHKMTAWETAASSLH